MYKPPVKLLAALFTVIFLYNSCKKDELGAIDTLFSGGNWELASLRAFNYIGDTQKATDTLNVECELKQIFIFNEDKTCTYANFHCIEQTATGSWHLSEDKLYLVSDISVQDTSEAGTSQPFTNTKIVNLGQYSMVIQTGDLQSNYPANQPRRILQYGFVRQKNK